VDITSAGTQTFWWQYASLPDNIKDIARNKYRLFLQNPAHPSFHRKKPRSLETHHPPIYEFRITLQYRALCVVEGERYSWFFIGDHIAFDREIQRLLS
jgi:hypothetical protein